MATKKAVATTPTAMIWKIIAVVGIAALMWAGVNSLVPGSGWLAVGIIAVIAIMAITGREKQVFSWVTLVLIASILWLFVSGWEVTGSTALWVSHRAQERMPRDNYNPKAETPTAAVRFYEKPEGSVERVPEDWVRNPVTGEKLARPGTTAFLELLTKYELQEAKKAEAPKKGASANPCAFRNTSGRYPARVLGPGRFEFTWESGLGRSTYEFDASGRGTWQQVYPERSGAFTLSSVAPEIFSGGAIHGLSVDELGVKYPFILECPASVLAGLSPH